MKSLLMCLGLVMLAGCGGGGGSGGGGTTPPPDTELLTAPPGIYSGVVDWTSNDQACQLTVHDNGLGQASGEVTLTLTGSAGVPGTLIGKKLSLIGDKVVSIRQTTQGVQIVAVDFGNILINVAGPQ